MGAIPELQTLGTMLAITSTIGAVLIFAPLALVAVEWVWAPRGN